MSSHKVKDPQPVMEMSVAEGGLALAPATSPASVILASLSFAS